MAQSNRRNNRRQPRAQQSLTQTPVNSFFYEKRGKIGVVLAKTMSGLTTEIQVDELDHGITWFMSRLMNQVMPWSSSSTWISVVRPDIVLASTTPILPRFS